MKLSTHSTLLFILLLRAMSIVARSPRHYYDRSAAAHDTVIGLSQRQSCPSDYKECGIYCIDDTYTCCPDLQGGCAASDYCTLGDNGEYGCCEDGEICTGDGGATQTTTFSDYDTSTITSYRATSTAETYDTGDDNLSWRTFTVTYDDGDRERLSFAIYDGDGIVIESDQLAWTTRVVTQDDGDIVTFTIASEIPEPLPFTKTYIDYTTTRDWALYEGGYVISSDAYSWETTRVTLNDGDITTATYANIMQGNAAATTIRDSSSASVARDSDIATRTISAGQPTVTVTQDLGATSSASVNQAMVGVSWLYWSVISAGCILITMVWL